MHFFVPDFPPYTYLDSEGSPSGIGTEAVKNVLKSMDIDYSLTVSSNHGRALQELRKQDSDGFFMATQNKERDLYAEFSAPLMVNRWVWVIRQENSQGFNPTSPNFKFEATVASLLNTNTHYWLKSNGYHSIHPAPSVIDLKQMLDSGEAQAVLIAEMTFLDSVEDDSQYQRVLEQERAFGIYISKHFLKDSPGFMSRLNQAIERYKPQ